MCLCVVCVIACVFLRAALSCPLMPRSSSGCREAVEKLRTVDDVFRQQLDLKEENHRREMDEMIHRKQEEIDAANKHVSHFSGETTDDWSVALQLTVDIVIHFLRQVPDDLSTYLHPTYSYIFSS